MDMQRQSQQSGPRRKRFFRQHVIALSVVSFITLLAIVLIVWIVLTHNATQSSFLIGVVVAVVTVVFGPTSWYVWIIETSRKSADQQPDTAVQPQRVSESQIPSFPISNTAPVANPAMPTITGPSTQIPVSIQPLQAGRGEANEAGSAPPPFEDTLFKAGYALSGNTVTYIERQADQEVFRHLRSMDYIALIDGRQQGKTSLIYHLMHKLQAQNFVFVVFDLSESQFQGKAEEEWYKTLGTSLLEKLPFLQPEYFPPAPTESTSWEVFLTSIAEASREANKKTVVVLDEVHDVPLSYATPFFTVIRKIFSRRPLHPDNEYLTFIISGTFHPDDLIKDRHVSRFIAQRIPLEDFNLDQVRQLVAHLGLPDELTQVIARRTYYWTDGQPYLTQRVCLLLSNQTIPGSSQELSDLIDRLRWQLYDDRYYLQRINKLHEQEPELFQDAVEIANGNRRPAFSTGLIDAHYRLAYIYGVIKADGEGRCRISNRICEHALTRIITQRLQ